MSLVPLAQPQVFKKAITLSGLGSSKPCFQQTDYHFDLPLNGRWLQRLLAEQVVQVLRQNLRNSGVFNDGAGGGI